MRIDELIVEPGRDDHIAHHGVTVKEVEEVLFGTPLVLRARHDRYHVTGQTTAGRYLTVFVAPRGQGAYGLITARDADRAERRRYQAHGRR